MTWTALTEESSDAMVKEEVGARVWVEGREAKGKTVTERLGGRGFAGWWNEVRGDAAAAGGEAGWSLGDWVGCAACGEVVPAAGKSRSV